MSTSSLAGPPELISRERAETLLEPYVDLLNRIIEESWEAWKADYQPKMHILDARARAANVFCEIVYRAERAFGELDGVTVRRRVGTLTIFIGQEITLRFKKLKKDGRCSNIMTDVQRDLLAQMRLPGMLHGTMMHAGYQLDDVQQEIARKAVVCQHNKRVLWQIPLNRQLAGVVTIAPTGTPSTPSTQPRYVAKDHLAVLPEVKVEGGKG